MVGELSCQNFGRRLGRRTPENPHLASKVLRPPQCLCTKSCMKKGNTWSPDSNQAKKPWKSGYGDLHEYLAETGRDVDLLKCASCLGTKHVLQ